MSKPHIRRRYGCWQVFSSAMDVLPISSWPALDMAWQRYNEYRHGR